MALVEEAIAEQCRQGAGRNDGARPLSKAFGRIRSFLTALANAARGRGFVSAAQVFQRIVDGDVGGHGPQSPQGEGREAQMRTGEAVGDGAGGFRRATTWVADLPRNSKAIRFDRKTFFSDLMTDVTGGVWSS